MGIFLIVGDLKKVGGSGKKGDKMCGCLQEKDYKHTPLARKNKLPIGKTIAIILSVFFVLSIILFKDAISGNIFSIILRYKCHVINHPPVLVLKNNWMFHKEETDYCF